MAKVLTNWIKLSILRNTFSGMHSLGHVVELIRLDMTHCLERTKAELGNLITKVTFVFVSSQSELAWCFVYSVSTSNNTSPKTKDFQLGLFFSLCMYIKVCVHCTGNNS